MFYFSIFTVLFLVLFFLPIHSWTKWSVLGTIILLITSHLYVQTDAIKWNVAFIFIFGLAVFLFTCFGKKCLQNLILIAALAMFSSGLEWFLSVHHEFLRMDLWLLRGLCFFIFFMDIQAKRSICHLSGYRSFIFTCILFGICPVAYGTYGRNWQPATFK